MTRIVSDNLDWAHIGGDLEAKYDGKRYVDVRVRGKKKTIFLDEATAQALLLVFAYGKAGQNLHPPTRKPRRKGA